MFTEESIILRDFFFPRMNLSNSIELDSLYKHFRSLYIHPVNNLKSLINKGILTSTFIINGLSIKIIIDSKKKHQEILQILIKILQFMCSLSEIEIKKLTININLRDKKKYINKNTEILTEKEVNSGYCRYISKTNSEITIYRIEELLKVFIHETIHALHFDDFYDPLSIIKYYKKKYNISSDKINTNEAYTEIWANLINCYLISQRVGRSNYNLFLILVGLEKEFSKFQCEKVMYLTKLDGKKTIDINENTNVLAYYVIRNEIFEKLNSFLKHCKNNNHNYVKHNDLEGWLFYLKKNKKVEKKNRRFNKIDKEDYIFKTMRMSLNELDIYA